MNNISLSKLAKLSGLHRHTISKMVKLKRIHTVQNGGRIEIEQNEVIRFLSSLKNEIAKDNLTKIRPTFMGCEVIKVIPIGFCTTGQAGK